MQSNHPVLSFQSIILFQNKFNAHTQILYWFQLICHTYKVFHSLTKTWFFSPPMQSAVQKVSNIQRGPGEDYINLGFIAEQMSLKWANITHRVHFVSWKRLALAYQYEENKPSPRPSNVFCPCFSDEEVKTGYPVRTANNPYSPTKYRRPFQYEHVFQQ